MGGGEKRASHSHGPERKMIGRDRENKRMAHFARGNKSRQEERTRRGEKERQGVTEVEMESQREIGGMSSSPLMQRAKLTRTSFLTRVTLRLCEPRYVYQRGGNTRVRTIVSADHVGISM